MNTLYLVATPIGNLEDISLRALRILKEVSLIAAEDTRHSRKLLSHYDIHTPITSYYDHNKQTKTNHIIAKLSDGDVALISDAGMPGLNDPGYLLVNAALDASYAVTIVPGPTAPISALVLSGLPNDQFTYLGYLPRKQSSRIDFLQKIISLPYTLIFFETPHRLLKALEDIHQTLGNRRIAVAGELTKLYEEVYRGTISQAIQHYQQYPARGEFTLVIEGAEEKVEAWTEAEILQIAQKLLDKGTSPSETASQIAKLSGWKKKEIYQLVLNNK